MYIVEIINENKRTEIHGKKEKLRSGSVVKAVNSIDSFSFSLFPFNAGYDKIHDFLTLVSVYNTRQKRYEFLGRVIYSKDAMDESGLITKEVTCESYFGFLCDSQQAYVTEQNWTVEGLLRHIIDQHNSQVEDYKKFTIGTVTVTDPNDNLYLGIQRENSWKTIEEKLIKKLGGEIRFRVVEGVTYLDYLTEIGERRSTKIEMSRNMKSITREDDPTAYITRLIPLGQKLSIEETVTDEEGNETTQTIQTEERLGIESVNDGLNYIEDEEAKEKFGIRVAYVEFDDVTDAMNLLRKGREYLTENNRLKIRYAVSALDLSLLGLDIDDFDVCNYHPIKHPLLGIDDVARIVKKTVDVCEEIQSSIEIGDSFKTLSDIQIEQAGNLSSLENKVGKIESDYVTNEKLVSESMILSSLIRQTVESIMLSIEQTYTSVTDTEEFRQTIQTELSVLTEQILMNFTTTTEQIESVDGDLQSKFNELYKYIRFSEDGITIGDSETGITLELDNDMIAFKKNGVQFGWWDGVDFHTGNIIVEVNERAQFGNFAFVPRSDGSLSFLKVGE